MDATKTPKVKKESKNKIKVEFEGQLSTWERLKLKVFSMYFLKNIENTFSLRRSQVES